MIVANRRRLEAPSVMAASSSDGSMSRSARLMVISGMVEKNTPWAMITFLDPSDPTDLVPQHEGAHRADHRRQHGRRGDAGHPGDVATPETSLPRTGSSDDVTLLLAMGAMALVGAALHLRRRLAVD